MLYLLEPHFYIPKAVHTILPVVTKSTTVTRSAFHHTLWIKI